MRAFKSLDNHIQATIDTKGLNQPLPLFYMKKELGKLSSGQILQVDVTDPDSRNDFSGWCERLGHKYLGEKDGRNCISLFIKKG